MTTTSSLAFAKGRGYQSKHNVKANKRNTISLQKGLKAIAPQSTTSSAIDVQIVAQASVVKNAYDAYNTNIKQIMTKRFNASKLIMQIRRNKQTLSSDQYTNLNTLVSTINSESNNLVAINGINSAINIANGKNSTKLSQVTLQDLTTMLNNIAANTTHLNTISATYDIFNATLTGVANTTTSEITTPAAITN